MSIPSDVPVVRHVDEVAFLRNLAKLEANHSMPGYPYGSVSDFHVDRVCTDPVREPWWSGRHWEKRLRDAGRDNTLPFSWVTTPLSLTCFPAVPGMGPSYAARLVPGPGLPRYVLAS